MSNRMCYHCGLYQPRVLSVTVRNQPFGHRVSACSECVGKWRREGKEVVDRGAVRDERRKQEGSIAAKSEQQRRLDAVREAVKPQPIVFQG